MEDDVKRAICSGRARQWLFRILVAGGVMLFTAPIAPGAPTAGASAGEQRSIQDIFAPGLKDLTVNLRRKDINMRELNKISRDFANAYRMGNSLIRMKEPDKFRLDARVGPLKFEYIVNGGRRITRAPLVKEVREIGTDPGKRQGPLEVGLVTQGSLIGYKVEHLDCTTEGGQSVCRYRLRYSHLPERYELIWVDTERKCLKKRQFWTNEEKLNTQYKMEFTYLEPRKVGAVWVPTRIEVRNSQGRLAGVTEQTDIQVNTGLEDSLFKF
jgi:outer membrane lipoprotein-sorting protein